MAKSPLLQRRPIRNSGFRYTSSEIQKESNTAENFKSFKQDLLKQNELVNEESAEESEKEISEMLEITAKKPESLYPELGSFIHEHHSKSIIEKERKQQRLVHDHTQTPPQSKNVLSVCNIAIAVIVIVILCVFCLKPYLKSKPATAPSTLSVVKELKTSFPRQLELSWRIIKSALDEVVNKTDPTQPAIVLFLSAKGAEKVTDCIAKNLAYLIANIYGEDYPKLNGLELKGEPDKIKKIIDNTFQKALTKEQHHVILINHLDSVPAKAAMMLHSYCDHENAPYKHAVFIMTIYSDENIASDADSREFDRIASYRLSEVWHDLGRDQLFALLSRIVVSVAGVIPEELSYCF